MVHVPREFLTRSSPILPTTGTTKKTGFHTWASAAKLNLAATRSAAIHAQPAAPPHAPPPAQPAAIPAAQTNAAVATILPFHNGVFGSRVAYPSKGCPCA